MGYYIETKDADKAGELIEEHEARLVWGDPPYPSSLSGETLVCVVDNGLFKAAGVIYSDQEYDAFTDPRDFRPKEWLILDESKALELCPKLAKRVKSYV